MCFGLWQVWSSVEPLNRRYLDQVARYVPPCDVEASGQVRQGEALVDRTDVSDAVAGVHHHAGQESCHTTTTGSDSQLPAQAFPFKQTHLERRA